MGQTASIDFKEVIFHIKCFLNVKIIFTAKRRNISAQEIVNITVSCSLLKFGILLLLMFLKRRVKEYLKAKMYTCSDRAKICIMWK